MNIKNIKKKNIKEPYDYEYEMSKFRSRSREKEVEKDYPSRDSYKVMAVNSVRRQSIALDWAEGATVKQLANRYDLDEETIKMVIRDKTGEEIP